jgi:hypothetical protein
MNKNEYPNIFTLIPDERVQQFSFDKEYSLVNRVKESLTTEQQQKNLDILIQFFLAINRSIPELKEENKEYFYLIDKETKYISLNQHTNFKILLIKTEPECDFKMLKYLAENITDYYGPISGCRSKRKQNKYFSYKKNLKETEDFYFSLKSKSDNKNQFNFCIKYLNDYILKVRDTDVYKIVSEPRKIFNVKNEKAIKNIQNFFTKKKKLREKTPNQSLGDLFREFFVKKTNNVSEDILILFGTIYFTHLLTSNKIHPLELSGGSKINSERHFRVCKLEGKNIELGGVSISSKASPGSAARKLLTSIAHHKGLTKNKKASMPKVKYCIQEYTQGSSKKIYGPYVGHYHKYTAAELKKAETAGGKVKFTMKPVVKLAKGNMKGGSVPSYEVVRIENKKVVLKGNNKDITVPISSLKKSKNLEIGSYVQLIEKNQKRPEEFTIRERQHGTTSFNSNEPSSTTITRQNAFHESNDYKKFWFYNTNTNKQNALKRYFKEYNVLNLLEDLKNLYKYNNFFKIFNCIVLESEDTIVNGKKKIAHRVLYFNNTNIKEIDFNTIVEELSKNLVRSGTSLCLNKISLKIPDRSTNTNSNKNKNYHTYCFNNNPKDNIQIIKVYGDTKREGINYIFKIEGKQFENGNMFMFRENRAVQKNKNIYGLI